jgi:diaminopimelate epimerase
MRRLLDAFGFFLKKVFDKGFALLVKNSKIAVEVVENFKLILNSPVVDILVAITPTAWDDVNKEKIRKGFAEVVIKVGILHNIIQASDNPTVALQKMKEYLESISPELHKDWWAKFAAEFAGYLSDGKFEYAELMSTSQAIWLKYFYKPAA